MPTPLLVGRVIKSVAEFVPVPPTVTELDDECQPLRVPDPSPAEIARLAAEIRRGWSADELERRCEHPAAQKWTVPECVVNLGE